LRGGQPERVEVAIPAALEADEALDVETTKAEAPVS
jgi:hypothetical protein